MIKKLKNIKISAVLVASLSAATFTQAAAPSTSSAPHPGRCDGFSFGLGAGVKLINLKNVVTKNAPNPVVRSGDMFSNISTPVIGVYLRKYTPDLLFIPTFFGFEFEYLTDAKKTNVNGNLGLRGAAGFQYREKFDSRLMFGAQLLNCSQVDFWGQVGLAVTNFDYEGRIIEGPNATAQSFPMNNNLALAPAGGLEMRFSRPNLVTNGVVTDFIVGWTATYRNAFSVQGTGANTGNNYSFAMSSNWSHTFGLKVMFRF